MFTDAMGGDLSKFSDMTSLRYRQIFFERYIAKLDKFNAWTGEPVRLKHKMAEYSFRVVEVLDAHLYHFLRGDGYTSKIATLLLINAFQKFNKAFIAQRPFVKTLRKKLYSHLGHLATSLAKFRAGEAGYLGIEVHIGSLRKSVVWSVYFDEAIGQKIINKEFPKRGMFTTSYRETAIKWLTEIRSPAVRDKIYRHIIKKYGLPKLSLIQKGKNYYSLYKAFNSAEQVWTKETLEELKNSSSDLDRMGIIHKAWKDHVQMKAASLGVSEQDAMMRLKTLYDAFEKTQHPIFGEMGQVFPEGSRFKDSLLEEFAAKTSMNFDEIKFMETKKSYNTESPLHKFTKAAFELLDEAIGRFAPLEQAEVALYLAGVTKKLDKKIQDHFKEILYKGKNRRKAIKRHGVYANLHDIRELFMQSHPEERLVAFRALFVKGMRGEEAGKLLEEKLLFADPKMPVYLKKIIAIYTARANELERSMFLSWILANSSQGALSGPEVVKLMIEQGGVGAAKMAQLVASHGFRLPVAYQEILEKFKGKAQRIDKMEAMNFIKQRLPEEKYKQIKSLDTMFGAGSLKMAFGATLLDGKKVVVMLAREFIEAKVDRELELMEASLKDVMADKDLRLESLPTLVNEVKRIILEEMSFENEREMMKAHKRALERRPYLVKKFGNEVKVFVPQPLEGWEAPGIIVEEYVESIGFSELPKKKLFGWTQRSLARASINEIVNQMMVYMFPSEYENGKLFLDIDPHEENQLAKKNLLGFRSGLVNIDLGQTMSADPQHVKDLVKVISSLYLGRMSDSLKYAMLVVDFENKEQVAEFRKLMFKAKRKYSDPIEALTEALEELQLRGVGLKQDYIYFQKLFSTMVGLKRHVVSEPVLPKFLWRLSANALGEKSTVSKKLEAKFRLAKQKARDNNTYMTRQIQKTVALRALTNPGDVYREVSDLYNTKPSSCRFIFK